MRLVLTFFVLNLTFVALGSLVALVGGVLALRPVHQAWLECLAPQSEGVLFSRFLLRLS